MVNTCRHGVCVCVCAIGVVSLVKLLLALTAGQSHPARHQLCGCHRCYTIYTHKHRQTDNVYRMTDTNNLNYKRDESCLGGAANRTHTHATEHTFRWIIRDTYEIRALRMRQHSLANYFQFQLRNSYVDTFTWIGWLVGWFVGCLIGRIGHCPIGVWQTTWSISHTHMVPMSVISRNNARKWFRIE